MRMERNKEIATSANLADSLTEQQCDVLEWASDMRHVMHKNSEALYDVNAPKHKEIKAFISDTHYSQNPNNLNKRLKDAGLPLIKWSFDDTRIPTNELAMILDNRRLEKSRKRQCIRTLEKANADIENYLHKLTQNISHFIVHQEIREFLVIKVKGSVWSQGMLPLQKAIQLWESRVLRII